MKTMRIVGVGLWFVLAFACKEDEDVSACMKMEGTWQCQSWKEDGEEFFGDTIYLVSSEIIFKSLTEGQGDYEWNFSYLIGGNQKVIGSYAPNASCDQVTITPKGGFASTYDFEISGNDLILSGVINNIDFELLFQKQD